MPGQQGHMGGMDALWYAEAYSFSLPLLELSGIKWDFDLKAETGGKGLGIAKNWYAKTVDAPEGSGTINRKELARADGGLIFLDLAAGAKYIHQEGIATAATSYTPSLVAAMISILGIRL